MSDLIPSEFLLRTSRDYAIYVCSNRAIPAVTDGLKNGQRIALWLLRNTNEKLKTYALAGLMGYTRLYVHGDASATSAISLLAAPYKNNVPLIEGLGQFGSRTAPDKDGIGAPRYTDVRRSKAAETFLHQDLDLVPQIDNYDGSAKEPVTFLPLIPTVLLNGVSGVAVGWSTDILPRSLKALVDATRAAVQGDPVPVLVPHYERYDITVKATGKPNQWEYSGKVEIVDSSTIRITELPPGMSIETMRKRLIEMEDAESIMDFADRSTENINISVKMKRGTVKDWTQEQAIDFFKLREKVTERIVVIDWAGKAIRTYDSAEQLVVDFAAWRLGWYTKRFQKLLADASYELNYWYALRSLFVHKFPALLGSFLNRKAMENSVTDTIALDNLTLDAAQMDRVCNLATYRWTHEFEMEINKKIAELEANIAEYNAVLGSPEKLKKVYLNELDKVAMFKG